MAYKKKTIRHMGPQARKFARMINEIESTTRRLKNFMAHLQDIELDSLALQKQNKYMSSLLQKSVMDIKDADLQDLLVKHSEPQAQEEAII